MEVLKELFNYKHSEDSVLLNSRVKYWIFCNVLDLLLHLNCYHTELGLSSVDIEEHLHKCATYDYDCKVSINQINLWLSEMVLLGLIQIDPESKLVSLSDEGYKACQDQRFHSLRATLYEAKHSRQIACWSFIIAVFAFVISIIGLL